MPRDPILEAFAVYREARVRLLNELECAVSNRDPMSEFSERLVARLLDGTLAPNRGQPGYDLTTPSGDRVQVKYLANPAAGWINEHHVHFGHPDCDSYALVFFEDLLPIAVVVFPRSSIGEVCVALGKRHPNQDFTLQLTRRNFRQILLEEEDFRRLRVRVFRFDDDTVPGQVRP